MGRFYSKYILLVLVWVTTVSASLIWNTQDHQVSIRKVLLDRGRSLFEMVLVHRQWNSMHKGVYVQISDLAPPNPYLIDPLRDISCTGGLKLTKINPAYMTRQLSDLIGEEDAVRFHITSLSPIRSGNVPDNWEASALKSFEDGEREVFELVGIRGKGDHYRYMAPLSTQKSCLKCHGGQGYRVGDVRGGISVSFNAEAIVTASIRQLTHMKQAHGAVLLFGLFVIFAFSGLSIKAERRGRRERDRFRSLSDLSGAVHWELDVESQRFTFISPRVQEVFGYPASDWKDFDFWLSTLHPEDRQWAPQYCMEHTGRGEDHILSYRAMTADGREIWIRDIVNVIKDHKGAPLKLRGLFVDDTKLKRSLIKKATLLKEVHRHVSSNMEIIASMQELQGGTMKDPVAQKAFSGSMQRLRSMAIIHEMIYQSGDFASLDANAYLEKLTTYIAELYGFPPAGVSTEVNIEEIHQDLDALVPMGFILYELLSNAMEHAFEDYSVARARVSLVVSAGGFATLVVSDNGKGLPTGIELENATTLGLRLVGNLLSRVQGTADISRHKGTTFTLRFRARLNG